MSAMYTVPTVNAQFTSSTHILNDCARTGRLTVTTKARDYHKVVMTK